MHFFKNLSQKVASLYGPRRLLVLLVSAATFVWLFNFSTVSFSNPSLIEASGHEGLLDLMPYYSGPEALAIIGRYGAVGRELYVQFLVADFIFVPIYSLGLALLFTRLLRAVFGDDDGKMWLNLLPLGIGLFDDLENMGTLGMLLTFPETNLAFGTLASLATVSKHGMTLVSVVCLVYLGASLLMRRLKAR